MTMIDLHAYDRERIMRETTRNLNNSLVTHKKFTDDKTDRLEMFAKTCRILTTHFEHIEPDQKNAARYFLLGQKAQSWFFKLSALADGNITEVSLDPEWKFNITAEYSDRNYTDSIAWKSALMLSVIARDKESISWLLEFPEERMRLAPIKGEEYEYLFVRFLKAYFRGEKNTETLLLEAYRATDPSMVPGELLDNMLDLNTPEMDVWTAFLYDDVEKFNQQLEKALLLLKKTVAADPKGFYSLINYTYTALASMAFDRGWEITVESPYMPKWMIEGKF